MCVCRSLCVGGRRLLCKRVEPSAAAVALAVQLGSCLTSCLFGMGTFASDKGDALMVFLIGDPGAKRRRPSVAFNSNLHQLLLRFDEVVGISLFF